MIVAGIDEAGYGPTLGPYVLGCAEFRVEVETGRAPDLYRLLQDAVVGGPSPDSSRKRKHDRVRIADSKELYSTATGLRRLEEALLSFLIASGQDLPRTPGEMLLALSGLEASALAFFPWIQGTHSVPPSLALPIAAALSTITSHAAAIADCMRRRGVELVSLTAVPSQPAEWNRDLDTSRNKAVTAFARVRSVLERLWREHGHEGVLVHVDKQGGRNAYFEPLSQVFPALSLAVIEEGAERSSYIASAGGREMHIVFAPRMDSTELPVALASIAAKYLRELFMERFNAFFALHSPGLAATAGYPEDARRWLAETRELRCRLQIHDRDLIRTR